MAMPAVEVGHWEVMNLENTPYRRINGDSNRPVYFCPAGQHPQ